MTSIMPTFFIHLMWLDIVWHLCLAAGCWLQWNKGKGISPSSNQAFAGSTRAASQKTTTAEAGYYMELPFWYKSLPDSSWIRLRILGLAYRPSWTIFPSTGFFFPGVSFAVVSFWGLSPKCFSGKRDSIWTNASKSLLQTRQVIYYCSIYWLVMVIWLKGEQGCFEAKHLLSTNETTTSHYSLSI